MNNPNENNKKELDLSHTFDDVIEEKLSSRSNSKNYNEVVKKKRKNYILIFIILISWTLAIIIFMNNKANTPQAKPIKSPDQYIREYLNN